MVVALGTISIGGSGGRVGECKDGCRGAQSQAANTKTRKSAKGGKWYGRWRVRESRERREQMNVCMQEGTQRVEAEELGWEVQIAAQED